MPQPSRRVEDVRRIGVLRANAVGDLVFVTPALRALRRTYPEAEIVLVGRQWHHDFLAGGRADVDRVIVSVPYRGVTFAEGEEGEEDPGEQDAFFERLRAERFDLMLQLHGGGKYSNRFVARAGARVTAGCRAEDAPPLDRWIPYVYYHTEILRFLEVVGLVGAATDSVAPRLKVLPRDREEAARLLAPLSGMPFAALHLGATDERRRWPVESFAEVGAWLRARGFPTVLVGDAADRPLGERFAALSPDVLDLIGRTSLDGLVGVLDRAHLLVGNDSGPRHLADAVGTPTLAVYWCGNLINAPPMSRTLHRTLPAWTIDCPVCGRPCTDAFLYERCGHDVSFVATVPPSQVIEEADRLLATIAALTPERASSK